MPFRQRGPRFGGGEPATPCVTGKSRSFSKSGAFNSFSENKAICSQERLCAGVPECTRLAGRSLQKSLHTLVIGSGPIVCAGIAAGRELGTFLQGAADRLHYRKSSRGSAKARCVVADTATRVSNTRYIGGRASIVPFGTFAVRLRSRSVWAFRICSRIRI